MFRSRISTDSSSLACFIRFPPVGFRRPTIRPFERMLLSEGPTPHVKRIRSFHEGLLKRTRS